ncbi:bacillithiol biosynthesis cysteine-adding enzyme BshC [Bacillus lacus]|uniref:Putative cysteine ligase BshC n=1 Tax=Metabacillus lacus TaxID=1983721 RepID=A0A7X2LYN5_9BACI|nr:bacillithiol biosynthesis cysteine-adding enzyme BshC [Metabacillus lacus]MRX70819.1 bacillithiol biosynthesis cysteine-adding enzyme BshC [Metabacillus lacus]
METFELTLHSKNRLISDLFAGELHTENFFDYNILNKDVYRQRAAELKEKEIDRSSLVSYLRSYHKRFNSPAAMKNIEKLSEADSVTVIAGQQAGLLTGPLYTIHKILSVIVFAKQQEQELNIPVVPVFWVAGEDHDFAEVNHVFVQKEKRIKKKAVSSRILTKTPVSSLTIDQKDCQKWIEEVFESFGETQYTEQLLQTVRHHLSKSETYTQFFEELIMDLFRHEGLIILNSADPQLRKLEKQWFQQIIKQSSSIAEALREQQNMMREQGYSPILEIPEGSASIFYHIGGERFLLQENNGVFEAGDTGQSFTTEELLKEAEEHPELFSNNVVSRPLMQEFLFPTLAFFAGPGEFTYWSELKGVFREAGMKMPPVLPRKSFSFLERSVETDINELGLQLSEVFDDGIEVLREGWLAGKKKCDISDLTENAKMEIETIHKKLREEALIVDKSLQPMLLKNKAFIDAQLDFLASNVEKQFLLQNEFSLNKFRRIETSLVPLGQPQERIWNIYYYFNKYGPDFLDNLMKLSYSFNNKHNIVRL